MNRLQKKCLIATAGLHLTLLLVLIFGSAFFVERSKPEDETQLLTVIPANLIDAAFSSGKRGVEPPPPAPTPITQPPVAQPKPEPPTPKPEVQPPAPKPEPTPTFAEKVKEFFKPEPKKLPPVDEKPDLAAEKPTKSEPKKIKVDLTKKIVRNTPKVSADTSAADAKRERDAKLKAIASAASRIKSNASSATEVDMPGASGESYASFKDALATIYYDAWTLPANATDDDAITKVRITIARDGTVISAKIIGPSGDARVDASVQRAIDRVSSVPPLPGGESQRTVILNFNLKTKRMIG